MLQKSCLLFLSAATARLVNVGCKTLLAILLFVLPAAHAEAVRLPGKFVWGELATDDVAAATRFYGGLFGWTFGEVDGYVTAYNQDEPVGGIFYYPRPKNAAGKPRWFGYISVDDVRQAERVVLAAGGKVRAPLRKLPGQDSEAIVFADPEGALFGVVHSAAGDPEDYLAATGDWIWIQLLSRNVHKAGDFYQRVAGYELLENRHADDPERFLLVRDNYARAAIMSIPAKRKDVNPLWLPFVHVENVAGVVTRAQQLGGKVLVEPRPDLFDGRVAVISDPTGAEVGVMEWDEEREEAP